MRLFRQISGIRLGIGKPHLSLGNLDMAHHVHYSLNRFRIITFRKKAADFRNNVPIFVHAKGFYVSLFGDTNISIINEICNVSRENQPWLFSLFSYLQSLNY